MQKKTKLRLYWKKSILGSILILILLSQIQLTYAFGRSFEGKTKFSGISSGIIRDLEVIGDTTYIASENGVFKILGGKSELISFDQFGAERGTVSDLFHGEGNDLWITEYGVGVFKLRLGTETLDRLYESHSWPKYAWKVIEVNDYLIVSVIQGILVVDKRSGEIQDWAKEIGVNQVKNIFSLSKFEDNSVYIAAEQQLIKINVKERSIDKIGIAAFPKLSDIEFVSGFDNSLYIGGTQGIYKWSPSTEKKLFFPFEKDSIPTHKISDIFITKNNRFFVAAGNLFELKDSQIRTPDFMLPLLNSESIKSIVKLDELMSGELLLASSQLGLILLSSTHEAINIVHQNDNVLRKNIKRVGFISDSELIVGTAKKRYFLELETASLSHLIAPEWQAHQCNSFREIEIRKIYIDGPELFDYCTLEYRNHINIQDELYYSYFDDGVDAYFDVIKNEKVLDRISAPRSMVNSFITYSGEIIGFDKRNAIHIQLSKFNWKTIYPDEGGWNSITCLIETDESFLVCTSGNGIKEIYKKSGIIEDSKILTEYDARFIRGGVKSASGNLWFTTNKGLFLITKRQKVFSFSESDGVFDTDFEYGGIFEISGKLLVLGDRYSYVIREEKAVNSIIRKASLKRRVIFSDVSWTDADERGSILSPMFIGESNPIDLPSNFSELKVEFRSNSFSEINEDKLEFRILGIDNVWKLHPQSQAFLSISDIDPGSYELQARVVGNETPVNSLLFTVKKPIYLSNQAFMGYLILLSLLTIAYKSRLLRKLWLEFKTTQIYTALTRYEITDGQSKFEKMLRSKDNFINELTHELSTPIQVIKGALEDVTDSSKENTKELISIKTNMRRVEQLIEQMRNGAPHAFDAEDYYKVYTLDAIRFIVNSLEPLAKQKRQSLDVRIKGKHSISLINDSLEKILSNLLQNAIKYTPEHGNIKIAVVVDSKELKIVVSDDGEGIEEHLTKAIFERFKRGNTKETGEGIGLAIVKSLVELNQGTIEVESIKGVGSKFTVRLPIDDIEYINVQQEKREINERADQRKSILVVDDSREFRAYMFDLLSNKYRCLVAKNGEQALEVMQQFLVDLVVTDQIMPTMDGLTLVKEIRSHAKYAATPILMLSAKTDAQFEKSALTEKVDYILSKPTSREDLLLRLEHLLTVRDTQSENVEYINKPEFEYGCLDIPTLNCEKDMSFYLNFIAVLEKNYQDENFNRDQAAAQLLMSTRSLNRRLSELFEYNFSEFLSRYRIERSIPHLLAGETILETCLEVGFVNAAYFSTSFKKIKHIPPKKYAEQYANSKLEVVK